MRVLMCKKVSAKFLLLASVMFFISLSVASYAVVEGVKAIHIDYESSNVLYEKLHRECEGVFGLKRMIAGEDVRSLYDVEVVSLMPAQKTATALCVSKKNKNTF